MGEGRAAARAAFHGLLLEGCPHPRLHGIALGLRDCAQLYRRWSGPPVATSHLQRPPARCSTRPPTVRLRRRG